MTPIDLPTRADVARIAREAGELTLCYFRRPSLQVNEKPGNQGLVTEADLASETLIRKAITERFPGHAVLGEESGWTGLPGVGLSGGRLGVWIVDPIDGTTNFSNGNTHYCVSVGFAVVESGRAQLEAAAIAHPPSGDLYTAIRGQGALVNEDPLRVSPNSVFGRASFATGFSSNKGEALGRIARAIEKVQDASIGLRVNGAAALDLALTARGVVHGFFERALKPWDLAAGALLVQEAGGKVTNLRGEPFDVLQDEDILCANADLHQQLGDLLRELGY